MEVYDKIADLALLWRRAGEIFPRFADVACNWEEAFYQFLPRLMRADDRQTHLLFAKFLNLLGDGHTDYQFPRAFLREYGFAPFSLGFCADAYFLNGVSPEYGEFLGAAVEALDGRPFPEILNEAAKYSYHVGSFLPEYRLNVLLPLLRGQTHEMITSKGSFSFRLLPERPELLLARKHRVFEIRQLGNGILYVNLPDFLHADTAAKVRAALDETTPDGLILDIRDNIGGMTLFGAQVAELLIPGAFSGCRKQTRIMEGVDLAGASQILLESPEEQAREIAAGLYTRAQMEDARKKNGGELYQVLLGSFRQRRTAGTLLRPLRGADLPKNRLRGGGFSGNAALQSPGSGDRCPDLRHHRNAHAPEAPLRRQRPYLLRWLPAAGRHGVLGAGHPAGYSHRAHAGGYPDRKGPGAGCRGFAIGGEQMRYLMRRIRQAGKR